MGWTRAFAVAAGGIVGGGSLLCFAGGLFLPDDVAMSTAGHVSADPAAIRPFLTTHTGIAAWWHHAARTASPPIHDLSVLHVGGPAAGPGLVVAFDTGGVRTETWTLDRAVPDGITWTVDAGPFTVERTFRLVADPNGGTLVRWDDRGHLRNPIHRWLPLLVPEDEIVANLDLALDALDAVSAP